MKFAYKLSTLFNSLIISRKHLNKILLSNFKNHISTYSFIYTPFINFMFGFCLLFLPFFYFIQEIRNLTLISQERFILILITIFNFFRNIIHKDYSEKNKTKIILNFCFLLVIAFSFISIHNIGKNFHNDLILMNPLRKETNNINNLNVENPFLGLKDLSLNSTVNLELNSFFVMKLINNYISPLTAFLLSVIIINWINCFERMNIIYILPIIIQYYYFKKNEYFNISILIPGFIIVSMNYIKVLLNLLDYLKRLKDIANTLIFMSLEFIKFLGLSCIILFYLIGISLELGNKEVDLFLAGILLVILGNTIKFTQTIFHINEIKNNTYVEQLNNEIKEPLLLDA